MASSKLMCWGVQSRAFSLSSRAASANIFKDVVICGGMRTPIASFRSKLNSVPVTELGSTAIFATLEHAGIKPSLVQEAFVGVVLPADAGQAPARQAVLGAGLNVSTIVTAVNKTSASGMKSIMLAAEHLQLGLQDFAIGAGMENMSRVPFFLKRGDTPYGGIHLADGVLRDGLIDVYGNLHLGGCTDKIAKKYGVTREEQDEYAAQSYRRAAAAWESGVMAKEVVPVEIKEGKREYLFDMDEEFQRVNYERLPTLNPAFTKDGTITAGNASSLSDGAAAVLLARMKAADQHHIPPIAKILALADAATEPEEFSVAPTLVIPKLLEIAGLKVDDIDLFEINEAFAVTPILAIKKFNLDPNKVNVHGGAISLGDPVGMSGARIVVHLLHALKSGQKGLAAICNGGGGASGMIIEKL
uniref:acetyl-CoA C-acetyltransferase n=1 Tax=Ascaris suum TaxID=6253 RepID=F1L0C5_ASCSU